MDFWKLLKIFGTYSINLKDHEKPYNARHKSKSSFKILICLITGDFVFLFLAFLHRYTGILSDPRFNLTIDGSFGEFYQYFKEIFIAMIFAKISRLLRLPSYLVWSGLFLYFFFDDALRIHENLGRFIVRYFGYIPAYGLRAQDFAELTVFGFFGVIFFSLILFTYFRGDHIRRKVWQHLICLIILLVICGIGFDLIHSFFSDKSLAIGPITISSIIGVMEDFGEMLVMSLCTWYVVDLYKREKMK